MDVSRNRILWCASEQELLRSGINLKRDLDKRIWLFWTKLTAIDPKRTYHSLTHSRLKSIFFIFFVSVGPLASGGESGDLSEFLFPYADSVRMKSLPELPKTEFDLLSKAVTKTAKGGLVSNAASKRTMARQGNQCQFYVPSVASSVQMLDFNSDNTPDAVYSASCGEKQLTYFWIRRSKSFQFAGVTLGDFDKFFRKNKKQPYSVLTRGGWCCLGYIGYIARYDLTTNHGILSYQLAKQYREFSDLQAPRNRIRTIHFVVARDRHRLRMAPAVSDDQVFEYEEQIRGNAIAEFSKGGRGKAISKYVDPDGQKWWFVLMDNKAKTQMNHFYWDHMYNATDGIRMGWMKAEGLRIIK